MKTGDAVREIMKITQTSVGELADQIGKSPRLVSERLSQENISIKKLDELLRVMKYKILIVPREINTPSNSFKIE